MKNKHIRDLLDGERSGRFTAAEQAMVDAHVVECADCKAYYLIAVASTELLKERAAQTIEPSPFFATRVMAAVRERMSEPDPLSLGNLWRAARGMVVGMAGVILVLGGLTFADLVGGNSNQTPAVAGLNPDSAENIVFQDDHYQNLKYDPTNAQVYQTVFGPEDADAEY
jgi:hypothetical protein